MSATVNIAKVATGLVSAVSHWRFGNVNRRIVLRLAWPGAIGALIGVTILTNVNGDDLRPMLAVLLLVIGARILWRFRKPVVSRPDTGDGAESHVRGIELAGAAGGVTNGMIGAWGPVVTPFLLHREVVPRIVVGSVNTAEVAVAVVAAGSLLSSTPHGLEPATVAAMLIGGMVAAPFAALTIRHVPARLLGILVAGLLLLTNARELAMWAELGAIRWAVYAGIVLAVILIARPKLPSTEMAAQLSPSAGS